MPKGLAPSDLGDLLEQPLVAVLATYRREGSVLLSPVWHRWRDGGFDVVASAGDDIKVRHLKSDPRASIIVYEHAWPYRGIELRAEARILAAGAEEAVLDMAIRYLGREEGTAYAANAGGGTLIRLERGTIRAWDFSNL